MATAFKAKGTVFKVSVSAVFQVVPLPTSIGGIPLTHNKIETTDLSSAAETSLAGLLRLGPVDCEFNWDPADTYHAYLRASAESGAIEAFKTIYADTGAAEEAFSAWLSNWKVSPAVVDGLQKVNITFNPTGTTALTP